MVPSVSAEWVDCFQWKLDLMGCLIPIFMATSFSSHTLLPFLFPQQLQSSYKIRSSPEQRLYLLLDWLAQEMKKMVLTAGT